MRREWKVGDFAQSIDSGWVGRVVELDTPEPGYVKLLGVDPMLLLVCGGSAEYATCEDDAQWFDGRNLRLIERRG